MLPQSAPQLPLPLTLPALWSQLTPDQRQQLAQHLALLLRRSWQQTVRPEAGE